MTGFSFVFALFSLLLGLGMAEMFRGFAGLLKLHARARAGKAVDVRVGWLVPLMAALVVLNQLNFCVTAYAVRDTLPFSYLTLLGVVVVVGGYYLFASLVFPDDPGEWPDFDAYYDQHNRFILVGMLATNLVVNVAAGRYLPPRSAAQDALFDSSLGVVLMAAAALRVVLMLVLVVARGRRLNAVLLAVLITMDLGLAIGVAQLGLRTG
jgi:hypothetical protein